MSKGYYQVKDKKFGNLMIGNQYREIQWIVYRAFLQEYEACKIYPRLEMHQKKMDETGQLLIEVFGYDPADLFKVAAEIVGEPKMAFREPQGGHEQ